MKAKAEKKRALIGHKYTINLEFSSETDLEHFYGYLVRARRHMIKHLDFKPTNKQIKKIESLMDEIDHIRNRGLGTYKQDEC